MGVRISSRLNKTFRLLFCFVVAELAPAGCARPGEDAVGRFVITDFGAKADGATDCSAAIQAAIQAAADAGGGTVVFPPSSRPFAVRDTIHITHGNIEIEGTGAAILRPDGATQAEAQHLIAVQGNEREAIRDVTIRGLMIDANYFAQAQTTRPMGVEFQFVEGGLVEDVTITRAYVGLEFGRGCVNCEARRVTVTDYANDAFAVGGQADEHSGATARAIRLMDVTARDAPQGRDSAFEIEDGAQGVVIENALVENVLGDGFVLRNHNRENNEIHSRDIEVRNATLRNIGNRAVYARCAPRAEPVINSYHDVRLLGIATDAPLLFHGPMIGLVITDGTLGPIYLGYGAPGAVADPGQSVAEARLEGISTPHVRVNGGGSILLSNSTVQGEPGTIQVEGPAGEVEIRRVRIRGGRAGIELESGADPTLTDIRTLK